MARGSYKMRTVSRMTGFPPVLLRAWESRHGILRPGRGEGGHRLYTDEDLLVLRRVRELRTEGRSIGEIALLGRSRLLAEARSGGGPSPPATAIPPGAASMPGRDGDRWRREIVRAAGALDGSAIEAVLDEAFSILPSRQVVPGLIEPAAREIGDLWARGKLGVAAEHLATGIFQRRLMGLVARRRERGQGGSVLCACFPGEDHGLPALLVAFHLADLGVPARFLGAGLPFADLEEAIDLVSPRAVCLSVTREPVFELNRSAFLDLVRRKGDRVRFIAGGQGVTGEVGDLTAAGVVVWPPGRPVWEMSPEILAPRHGRRGRPGIDLREHDGRRSADGGKQG